MGSKTDKFQFGDFILDREERVLTRNGIIVLLPPKALNLLLVLTSNLGRVVDKNELMEAVWGDTFVEEGNLAYTVRLLRKTLGDDATAPKYIQTVPRRGYRFRPTALSGTDDGDAGNGLVGRVNEITELIGLLRNDTVRLVTLTGTGGTGKTSLAKAVTARVTDEFPDGVIFVDLTAISEVTLVLPALALQLGIRDLGTRPASALITSYIQLKSLLIILDNFEQVVSAGRELVQVLSSCPGTKILVTSREPLNLSIEKEFRVMPLEVPSGPVKDEMADLMQYEAVRLFVRRVGSARPDLELGDVDAQAVAAICRKLDGLPLALELAASRARILSIPEIHSKLEDRLALLTGGPRDAHSRQQTMRATIHWSYGLLSELERRIFLMLSVFEGGFTFEAAERVLAKVFPPQTLSGADTVNVVTSLSEKGLLLTERSGTGELRFRMLVVVRDFALETRKTEIDLTMLCGSHAEYYREFAETSSPHLFSAEAPIWINRFESELDNFRASIKWALEHDPLIAAAILSVLRHLAGLRFNTAEMRQWLEEILKISNEFPPVLQCDMLTGLGIICQYQHDGATARSAHNEGLEISRKIADKKLIARNLRGIGAIDYMELHLDAARERLTDAVAISRSINDHFGEAAALARLGDICSAEFDYGQARMFMTESLEIFSRLGYQQGVSSKLANLSITEFNCGNYDAARLRLSESLSTAIEIGNEIDFRTNLEVAAALMVEAGDYETAARLFEKAGSRCAEMAYFYEPVEQRFKDVCFEKLRRAMSETDLEAAFSEGRKMTFAEAVALTREVTTGIQHPAARPRLVRGRNSA